MSVHALFLPSTKRNVFLQSAALRELQSLLGNGNNNNVTRSGATVAPAPNVNSFYSTAYNRRAPILVQPPQVPPKPNMTTVLREENELRQPLNG